MRLTGAGDFCELMAYYRWCDVEVRLHASAVERERAADFVRDIMSEGAESGEGLG